MMSLMLKFKTDKDRERFLDVVRREKPDLLEQFTPNPLLPLIYARTDVKSEEWLRQQIRQFGETFDDLKFQIFAQDVKLFEWRDRP